MSNIRIPNPQSDAEMRRAFQQIIAELETNTADIATNVTDIATNTADIATNVTDIATNVSDIDVLEADEGYTRWTEVATASYTATPASTSTITFGVDMTATVWPGLPIKYTDDSGVTYRYAVLTAATSTLFTIAGAPLDTGKDIEELYIGTPEMVVNLAFFIAGTYGDGAQADLLKADMNAYYNWYLSNVAYLVAFSCVNKTADGGGQPRVNVQINNAAVSTDDTNKGVTMGAAHTWVTNDAVEINTTNYRVEYGEEVEVACGEEGGNGDAQDLTVVMTFVLE